MNKMPMNKNEANKRLIEKINAVEDSYPKNFSNTQKILLTTDGSITAILDVLYGKITLSTLEQHFEDATEEKLMAVATAACAEGDTLHNMPFEVTPEKVCAALKAADAYGRYFLGE